MLDVDLNLLRVFDSLFESRSATRSADRLGLTQSAVSHALGRLRLATGDRLFIRGPDGLQPTTRALEIAPGIREGLARLRGALLPSLFDLATTERQFVISAGTYFCMSLIPSLAARARTEAPLISFRIVPVGDALVASLDQGTVDLALGAFTKVPSRLVSEPLFEEELVWIAAAGNPIARERVGPKRLAAHHRIAISSGPSDNRSVTFAEGGLERQIIPAVGASLLDPFADGTSTVYDAQTAIAMVARTDAVALVPRRSAQPDVEKGVIAILSTTMAPTAISLSMLWHGKQREDGGLNWLRNVLRTMS